MRLYRRNILTTEAPHSFWVDLNGPAGVGNGTIPQPGSRSRRTGLQLPLSVRGKLDTKPLSHADFRSSNSIEFGSSLLACELTAISLCVVSFPRTTAEERERSRNLHVLPKFPACFSPAVLGTSMYRIPAFCGVANGLG